ncbi:MAG TPA: OsmC family protein [Acidobacteriota bacterium]|nr:OsmC family protein [Acidobacteriota bacterium]
MALVNVRSKENLTQQITAGKNTILADEPISAGGNDAGFDPYSLLLASLGSCIALTLKIYARNKGWDLQNVAIDLSHNKIHAEDCRDCETKEGKIDFIEVHLSMDGNLTNEQQIKLREIAKKCPVHRTLTSEIKIVDV